MLSALRIRNFSLLREVDLAFGPGLNVLSGESGSGKTLIVDAIAFALGKRPYRTVVGSEGDECCVEASFAFSGTCPESPELPEKLVVRRTFNRSGRSNLSLNGRQLRVSELRELMEPVVDISSQFSQQEIFRPSFHREILDAFGDKVFSQKLEEYRTSYQKWRRLAEELALRRDALARGEEERSYLEFLVGELSAAQVARGEKERVSAALYVLENAEEILRRVAAASQLLYEGAGEAPSAFDLVAQAAAELSELARDGRMHEAAAGVVEILARVNEGIGEAKDLLGRLGEVPEYSPQEMEQLRRRLDELNRLEHRYRTPADELPRLLATSRARLEALSSTPEQLEALAEEVRVLGDRLIEEAVTLNSERRAIARNLEASVQAYLQKLGFARSEFIADVSDPAEMTPAELKEWGAGRVEFIICLNPGEPARALAEVASGGEASRLLLAVKAALQSRLSYTTIVFDEIEAGVGGDIAFNVAGVLHDLAENRQVIAVTHLAPVAAAGKHHFEVRKSVRDERTRIGVVELNGAQRVRAVARMLGDAEQAESLALAEEFLRRLS